MKKKYSEFQILNTDDKLRVHLNRYLNRESNTEQYKLTHRVIREHGSECFLREGVHSPDSDHVIVSSTDHPAVHGVTDQVSHRGVVTLDPEVYPAVPSVEHNQRAVLATSHQDVLVSLASSLD